MMLMRNLMAAAIFCGFFLAGDGEAFAGCEGGTHAAEATQLALLIPSPSGHQRSIPYNEITRTLSSAGSNEPAHEARAGMTEDIILSMEIFVAARNDGILAPS